PHQIGREHGLLVEPGDPAALAAALEALLADPARAARLGAAGRARAQAEFTWERAAEIAFSGYEAVLARTPAVRGTRAGPAQASPVLAGVTARPR
ncbi:MAG: glycosyltransferase family 1 protein, partial [Acetobacteraceae bacterium]